MGVASAFSDSDICIVSIILYVLGNFGVAFKVPFPILGIWDMVGVEMVAFKLIENEA